MRKLYEKNEMCFAILWIVAYCCIAGSLRNQPGIGSSVTFLTLLALAAVMTFFVKQNKLESKYGLDHWPKNLKKVLYLIPLWIVTTGNLWDGISFSYAGMSRVYAILSMLLIGYLEEMIFRGFLFRMMLPQDGPLISIIVASVTFGIGHILNLFIGQTSFETIAQIIFAISLGFVYTLVSYRTGSLLPCILSHGLIDAFATMGTDSSRGDWTYFIAAIVIDTLYSIYLYKTKE